MRFRFVDRISGWDPGRSIRGIKSVSFEEYSLQGALGRTPALPATLQLESLLQLGNWLIMLTTDFRDMGVLLRLEQVDFLRPLLPGERMHMECSIERMQEDGVLFNGTGMIGADCAIRGVGALAVRVPLADYLDPGDMRTLAGEIVQK